MGQSLVKMMVCFAGTWLILSVSHGMSTTSVTPDLDHSTLLFQLGRICYTRPVGTQLFPAEERYVAQVVSLPCDHQRVASDDIDCNLVAFGSERSGEHHYAPVQLVLLLTSQSTRSC